MSTRLLSYELYRWRRQERIGLAEGPEFDDYISGSDGYAIQTLMRLSDRLRERRGPARASRVAAQLE